MSFASITFLFFFLPLTILGYFALPKGFRNLFLLVASLMFYVWEGGVFLLLFLGTATINYFLARYLYRARPLAARYALGLGVCVNLVPLLVYKYAMFFAESLGVAHLFPGLASLVLPLGISFFTFHSLSYLVDVYRKDTQPQQHFTDLLLYIFLFPQLIAGPIVRYKDIAHQFRGRVEQWSLFAEGAWRFTIGLGKKVLIANSLAPVADAAFAMQGGNAAIAWIGIIAYAFQIYYDFSGYSDMAVGIGKMFGFSLPENFNYPYTAQSVQDFWRRWHISLSAWFRDYVYIPLGGSFHGTGQTTRNILMVFLLVGLWHGAGWVFVLWGLWHGMFLVFERFASQSRAVPPRWVRHLYVTLVVLVGWVFFRADSVPHALQYVGTMAGLVTSAVPPVPLPIDSITVIALLCAILGMAPLLTRASKKVPLLSHPYARILCMISILLLCAMMLADGSYNPFIYYRF
ncbi:MAG: MBOAT family protein [Candidatus Pacebacteria bacterium]|nr:MBOAT family protein [Candidatus Paceibacterota bacterium]